LVVAAAAASAKGTTATSVDPLGAAATGATVTGIVVVAVVTDVAATAADVTTDVAMHVAADVAADVAPGRGIDDFPSTRSCKFWWYIFFCEDGRTQKALIRVCC
jgi:hypothetical protein